MGLTEHPRSARRSGAERAERSSFARLDAILGVFDIEHQTMSLSGIVAATGMPKTTVYRAVGKLLELRWLEHDRESRAAGNRSDRYAIGPRLFEIAALSQLRTNLRECALPYMQDLYEATHETIHLAVLQGNNVLYVEKISGHRQTTELSRVGGRMPAHCTAVGKVILAFSPNDTTEAVIARGLLRYTGATITSGGELRAELARTRADGVAYDREECDVGVCCVASPLFDPDGTCVAAMSITGPASLIQPDRVSAALRTASFATTRALRSRVKRGTDLSRCTDQPIDDLL